MDPQQRLGTTLGHHRIVELAGEGAFAYVYRAVHTRLDREAAVKFLKPELAGDEMLRKRMRREAVSAAKILDPNVAMVYDFGETADGAMYVVMEWIGGRTLAEAIAEAEPFPVERAGHLARQIASGLRAAHDRGLVHRDLKPENIMLLTLEQPASEMAKIVDFGFVRASDAEVLTRAGQILGTPEYLDPAVLTGKEATPASDLYGLGGIIYAMLAGEPPFVGRSPTEILLKQAHEPVPPLPQAGALEPLMRSLLAKDPAARPPSAQATMEAIDRLRLPPPPDPSLITTRRSRAEGDQTIPD